MRKEILLLISAIMFMGCYNGTKVDQQVKENSDYQKQLLNEDWTFVNLSASELGEEYGVKPIYGIQDNYFDISIGQGGSVAIKIMDASTDKCIRYVYVPEGETLTVPEIPQGLYYLKLAYGEDWMERHTDDLVAAKFTRAAFYERSTKAYDFGKKNSQTLVNYRLEINVVDGETENNFHTETITEEDFNKN